MPHKRAKRTVREQQRKERSAQTRSHYLASSFPLTGLEAQISPPLVALASVPKASLSPPRGCWTRRGSALNIGRSVRGSSSTRRTRKAMSAHRSPHHPRNVARTRWRVRLERVVNHWRREKIIQSALLLRSSPGNHSSISIGTPLSSQSFINLESESPFSLLCLVCGGFFFLDI